MRVKFVKTHPDARIPVKAYKADYCYDLYAVTEEEIAPNVWRYGFGIALQMDRGDLHNSRIRHAFKIFPRSSVWEHGMVLSNSEGIVDEGFRNSISAVFYHVLPNMPRYKVGERIAQLCVESTVELDFEEVEKLDPSERGLNGYGSSGLK